MKENQKESKAGLKEIIITAILTAFFTVPTSLFLQRNQLGHEQEYWEKRFKTEKTYELMKEQVNLMEEINSSLLEATNSARNVQIDMKIFNDVLILQKGQKTKIDFDLKEAQQRTFKYHELEQKVISKMQLIPVYFNNEVNELALPVFNALQDYSKYKMPYDNDTLEFFDLNNAQTLEKLRIDMISKMIQNISKSSNEVYEK